MNRNLLILVAEDDPNDLIMLKRAFLKNGINNPVHSCANGEEAIAYLQGKGEYADRSRFPFPSILITDLKMPRAGGFEILKWLRAHPECHVIPILIFSASNAPEDVSKAYRMGANAYLHKPPTFEQLREIVRIISEFWSICEKPPLPANCKENHDTQLRAKALIL